jgi:glycosyltransferase involved in cell wall biosynthesis
VAPFAFKALLKEQEWDIVIEDINKIPFYTPLYHRLPLLVVIPHLFADTVFKEINFILGLYIYLSEKPIPNIYKGFKFMVISESTKEDLVKRGIPEGDVFVIKCGIDQALYVVNPQIEKYSAPTIIYLGRLKKYKSIDHLLTGFSLLLERMPEARLVIVGEGDYKGRLMDLAGKLNLENRVEFTGYVDKQEKVKRLQKSWVAVYPSLKEGWGLTNIEANACGTPVIASNVPGLKDSVIEGKTGLLFEYGNVQQLSGCMLKILSDTEYRENLIRGGLSWARSFSWDETAAKTLELMKSIVEERLRGKG